MFKKWFLLCGAAVLVVACVISVTLSYAFNDNRIAPKASTSTGLVAVTAVAATPTPVPFAELVSPIVLKGHEVKPEDFLSDASDNEGVQATFDEKVDFTVAGRREVSLSLTYNDRVAHTTATLYILEPARIVELEAGTPSSDIKPEDFIVNYDILGQDAVCDLSFVTDLAQLDLNKIRRYEIDLTFNGEPFKSAINLTDTQPPTAALVNVAVNTGQSVTPEEFVRELSDVSASAVRFADENGPDVFQSGDHPVALLLEDAYGNQSTVIATLTVLPNTDPPVFTGIHNLEVLLGDSVMYRQHVSAADSFGNDVSFTVDSAAVDIYTPGTYDASYTATDVNGNTAMKQITVTVVEIDEEKINGMIDAILSKIISDDMTQREKAKKIFDWVCTHVSYVSDSPKDSVYEGAFRALQYRNGDCFTFYAVSEVLLTSAGVENMRIIRSEGATNHFWNLVNPDGEGWYHFDSTPTRVHGLDRFLFTDTQADEYTETIYKQTSAKNYYHYDKELYPEVVQ